jgi:hypothetical protein
MQNAECRMQNERKRVFHSAFCIPHSAFELASVRRRVPRESAGAAVVVASTVDRSPAVPAGTVSAARFQTAPAHPVVYRVGRKAACPPGRCPAHPVPAAASGPEAACLGSAASREHPAATVGRSAFHRAPSADAPACSAPSGWAESAHPPDRVPLCPAPAAAPVGPAFRAAGPAGARTGWARPSTACWALPGRCCPCAPPTGCSHAAWPR